MTDPILSARGLVKRFGRVTALDHCDFDLMPGEILAVIGDNGAGKSTLIKAMSGALIPDSGDVMLDGQEVRFTSPIAAREAGIETVYQTLAMSPAFFASDGRKILPRSATALVWFQVSEEMTASAAVTAVVTARMRKDFAFIFMPPGD